MAYDPAEPRRALRHQRQRGCMVYIPAEELARAGVSPEDGPPQYLVRGWGKRRVIVHLLEGEP